MLQRPVHKSTSKSCCPKNVGQQDSIFCNTGEQQNGSRTIFANQPVAVRGINNKNFS